MIAVILSAFFTATAALVVSAVAGLLVRNLTDDDRTGAHAFALTMVTLTTAAIVAF